MIKAARRPRHPRLATITLALACLAQPALAIDYIWKGGEGNWSDSGMWTLLGVPGSGDTAALASGSTWLDIDRSIDNLFLSGGRLHGVGHLTTGALFFGSGALGSAFGPYAIGATTVTTTAFFDGTRGLGLNSGHTLTLLGTSTWSAGGGAISGGVFNGSLVNSLGATFTDEGGAAPNATKTLHSSFGEGSFVNAGTYNRNGLGTTLVFGLDNTGTININSGTLRFSNSGQSSGTINVASGARLFLDSANSTAPMKGTLSGQIINAGAVELGRGTFRMAADLSINGEVKLIGDGSLVNDSTNTLTSLTVAGGSLSGNGHLTTGTLQFSAGALGSAFNPYTTGTTTVTGPAVFNGRANLAVNYGHTLTLLGTSTWTQGGGSLGSAVFGGAIVNGAGAHFTDEGALASNNYKELRRDAVGGGGTFTNLGTYTRSGLGTTRAYGFDNRGLLAIEAGTVRVDGAFRNTGTVYLANGSTLLANDGSLANAGQLTGTGTVQVVNLFRILNNTGMIDPGLATERGTLTIDGRLQMAGDGTLHIDLAQGQNDLLAITSDATFGGTLQIAATPGAALQLGDSFVVTTYGQRLAESTFANVQWLGTGANPFSLEYGAHELTLHVTSAMPVPEPASVALMLAGGLVVAAARRRSAQAGTTAT